MKYIKEYNHNLYHEIDSNKYHLSLLGHRITMDGGIMGIDRDEENESEFIQKNWISLTQDEISKISETFPKRNYKLNSDVETPKNSSMTISYITYSRSYYILINKLKDEWFYIGLLNTTGSISRYYACDQFDGLLNCLKHIYRTYLFDPVNRFENDKMLENKTEIMYKKISEIEFSEDVLFYADEFRSFVDSHYNFGNDKEITSQFFNHLMTAWEDFPEKEIQKIVSLLQDGFLKICHHFPEVEVLINKFAKGRSENIPQARIDIYVGTVKRPVFLNTPTKWASGLIIVKLKDEWYYVSTPDGRYPNSNSFYKCDQFEGLLSFLQMMIDNSESHSWPCNMMASSFATTHPF